MQGDELTRLYPEVYWSGYYYAMCNSITCLIIHFRKRREEKKSREQYREGCSGFLIRWIADFCILDKPADQDDL